MALASEMRLKILPQEITKILADPWFDAYNTLLLEIGSILKTLTSWMEGCPCHTTTVSLCSRRSKKRVKAMFRQLGHCPVSGCRAPEIATGALEDTLQEVVTMSLPKVLEKLGASGDAVEQQRLQLTEELQKTKSYVRMCLQLKFDCYNRLPWALMGLAALQHPKQVGAAQKVLGLYSRSMAAGFDVTHHHPLTIKFLEAGSENSEAVSVSFRPNLCDTSCFTTIVTASSLNLPALQRIPQPISTHATPKTLWRGVCSCSLLSTASASRLKDHFARTSWPLQQESQEHCA